MRSTYGISNCSPLKSQIAQLCLFARLCDDVVSKGMIYFVYLFPSLLNNKLPASLIQSIARIYTSTPLITSPPIKALAGTSSTSLTSTSSSSSTVSKTTPIPTTLTENMKSAIYLQTLERLAVEVMINRFISLFPDHLHEFAYSIVRDHLNLIGGKCNIRWVMSTNHIGKAIIMFSILSEITLVIS